MPRFVLACMLCAAEFEPAPLHLCPRCSGALEPKLALAHAVVQRHGVPERAYFDYLPLDSVESLDDGLSLRTPCRPAPRLGNAIGVPGLWVKDESRQPTGSTKDRMAAVVVAVLRQFGIKQFVASSTGNSSTALARAVRRDPAMQATFFCGRDFVANHDFTSDDRVTLTVVDGTYAQASAEARKFAERNGIHWEGGFFNWARREGLKLAYLEAMDMMDRPPDVIVQAISSGMGILAAAKGAAEYQSVGRLTKMPRFLMAQQDTCAPMASAWSTRRTELTDDDVIERPTGLATAILLGDGRPYYPYIRKIAQDSGGAVVSVTQAELVAARQMLLELEGLDVCHASAATIAAAGNEALAGRIKPDDVVLVNLTGRTRSPRPDSAQGGVR